ncbi:VOC family protein [Jannaschia sp. R86511]|uniref:VOC family protein n=1 Tax=Jannaschia sp. R86511 TaxID=3093853 RepID=UPI0036D34868
MTASLNTYLMFRDDAHDAIRAYQRIFGGTLTRSTYAEFGMAQDPADADKTMHSQLVTDHGWVLMASDTPTPMDHRPSGHALSLSGGPEDAEELRRCWAALVDGGQVQEPLAVAPWGDEFGTLTDRFGIQWMVNIGGAPAEG